jgi:hypothetical protein
VLVEVTDPRLFERAEPEARPVDHQVAEKVVGRESPRDSFDVRGERDDDVARAFVRELDALVAERVRVDRVMVEDHRERFLRLLQRAPLVRNCREVGEALRAAQAGAEGLGDRRTAQAELERARVAGDTQFVRAIAARSHQNGWRDLAERGAGAELVALLTDLEQPRKRDTAAAALFRWSL